MRALEHPFLVVVAEVADGRKAAESFLHSQLPIDVEFETPVQEISFDEAELELLYDSSTLVPVARVRAGAARGAAFRPPP